MTFIILPKTLLEIPQTFQYNIDIDRNLKGMDIMNIIDRKDELIFTEKAYTVYCQCMYKPTYEA